MEILGLGIVMIAVFVGFGLLIGILFGFFGMGGSFLVTPALLVGGYPATVAVGSGLAFVFGTSVIGALSHRVHGQVDHKLAVSMIPGMTVGIEVGKRVVFLFEELGSADFVIGVIYAGLLGAVGLVTLRSARTDDACAGTVEMGTRIQTLELPPMVSLPGGATVSVWIVIGASLGIGVISGCLGVGGGFLLVPVLVSGFGIPIGIAVGTSTLQIVVSGAFGTFVYALSNAVDVPVVAALLGGSALGTRIGAGALWLVNDADVEKYFAVVLLAGSIAVASKQVSTAYGGETLDTVSALLVLGATSIVCGAIVKAAIETRTEDRERGSSAIH